MIQNHFNFLKPVKESKKPASFFKTCERKYKILYFVGVSIEFYLQNVSILIHFLLPILHKSN